MAEKVYNMGVVWLIRSVLITQAGAGRYRGEMVRDTDNGGSRDQAHRCRDCLRSELLWLNTLRARILARKDGQQN